MLVYVVGEYNEGILGVTSTEERAELLIVQLVASGRLTSREDAYIRAETVDARLLTSGDHR